MKTNSAAREAATHTPGPWNIEIVEISGMQGQWRIMGNATPDKTLPHGGNWVGTVARSNGMRGLANARLIAAAPTMHDALLGLVDEIDRCGVKVSPELEALARKLTA